MKRPIPKIDELNLLDYSYADKIIAYLSKRLIKKMGVWAATFLSIKPADRMRKVEDLFEEWEDILYSSYQDVAADAYRQTVSSASCPIDKAWVNHWSKRYNQVTGYVFAHELDRKEARCAEAVAMTDNLQKTVDEQMRAFAGQHNQGVEDIVRDASIQGMMDAGVKKVKWITVKDERRCEHCRDLHGMIFDIDKIPPKPHRRCRCQVVPVREGAK